MNIGEYTKLKKQVEDLQRKAERISGRREEVMKQIKERFDCDTLGQAEELLAQMEEEVADLKEKLHESLQQFKDKYGDLLEEI